ncbi:small ubiquitin-related modifier 3-like [Rhopalosiphum maidis]|uniref:small ubiquitin-related modifier 3-like n=1 Tax=Rhopalosiphum maidis TaxID=43146 RepID=UPI000F00A588|nr:small ubiquitin-related modifier 3-like [Rhopalosiphum maidis]
MAENKADGPQRAIMLHVKDLDGFNHIRFNIKKNAPLEKLKISYCERTGSDMEKICFLFEGKKIRDVDTATSMGMVNNDTIDVINLLSG